MKTCIGGKSSQDNVNIGWQVYAFVTFLESRILNIYNMLHTNISNWCFSKFRDMTIIVQFYHTSYNFSLYYFCSVYEHRIVVHCISRAYHTSSFFNTDTPLSPFHPMPIMPLRWIKMHFRFPSRVVWTLWCKIWKTLFPSEKQQHFMCMGDSHVLIFVAHVHSI